MWGLEQLWPELFLLGGAVFVAWRSRLVPLFVLLYGLSVAVQPLSLSRLLSLFPEAKLFLLLLSFGTALAWLVHPLPSAAAWASLLQVGAYGLLVRSTHLAFTWGLMESAALAGYFFVAAASESSQRWAAALRYFMWNVLGTGLLFLGIAVRLAEGHTLGGYPLGRGGPLADALLSWGWAIKVGFIPWHFWLLSLYRVLPLAWAAWYAVVPKGALLLNFLQLLPSLGEGVQPGLLYALSGISLVAGYAAAWRAQGLTEMLFWASFSQVGYMGLVFVPGAQETGWNFWLVYGAASFLSFLYVERPWRGRFGDTVGLLLLSNLAGLPPVLGFWVKLALFESAFRYLGSGVKGFLIGAGLLATVAGFAVYGRLLWRIWQERPRERLSLGRRVLYVGGAGALFGLGLWGLGGL